MLIKESKGHAIFQINGINSLYQLILEALGYLFSLFKLFSKTPGWLKLDIRQVHARLIIGWNGLLTPKLLFDHKTQFWGTKLRLWV